MSAAAKNSTAFDKVVACAEAFPSNAKTARAASASISGYGLVQQLRYREV